MPLTHNPLQAKVFGAVESRLVMLTARRSSSYWQFQDNIVRGNSPSQTGRKEILLKWKLLDFTLLDSTRITESGEAIEPPLEIYWSRSHSDSNASGSVSNEARPSQTKKLLIILTFRGCAQTDTRANTFRERISLSVGGAVTRSISFPLPPTH